MKYSLSEISRITSSELIGTDHTITDVATDSRTAWYGKNTLFIAINGKNHDGHSYISEMYSRGTRAFLVDTEPDMSAYPEAGFILAQNSLRALQALAGYHRSRFKGTVIAVTGSNGKTVVKEWIAQLCPANLKIFRSPRSYNSQLGVPLSLLKINGDEDLAVIEAGISEPGEMLLLEEMIKPDLGIITNAGTAHLANFKSVEHLAEEKLILFKNTPVIVYNTAQTIVSELIREKYSNKKLFPIGGALKYKTTLTGNLELSYGRDLYIVRLNFTDRPSVENTVSAIAVFLSMGVPPEQLLDKISGLVPVVMRMELIEGVNGSKLINDSYNSDINSLGDSLDYLRSVGAGCKKILILSDLLQAAAETYMEVAGQLQDKGIDGLIGIGSEISSHADSFQIPAQFYTTTGEFLRQLDRKMFGNSAVLIKGSRIYRFELIARALEHKIHSTILEVNLDAMIHNLNHYRAKLAPGVKIMAMVKAFSYGSGSFEVASMLQHQRVDYLAVAFADEGVALREAGITMPIVILNADSWSFPVMIEHSLEPEIYSFHSLNMFVREVRRYGETGYPIHIKIDSGMHRLGFELSESAKLEKFLKSQREVIPATIFTHFAVSESPAHDGFTLSQIDRFLKAAGKIQAVYPGKDILLHCSNSSAIERFPQAQFDMVRLGIGLYGASATEQHALLNASTLKSRIIQIKSLQPGETVGYERNGKILGPSVTATVPIGYADGLDRRLGNGAWKMLVNGHHVPTIGNICMDTCMLDITGVPAKEGDEVIVFGHEPSATDMAEILGTIPYEIFTSISSRVKRVYIKE